MPLLEQKGWLLAITPKVECWLLYLDSIAERGRDLFRAACERDLESIVGKWARGTYQTDGRSTSWLKIRNPEYSQIAIGTLHSQFVSPRVSVVAAPHFAEELRLP